MRHRRFQLNNSLPLTLLAWIGLLATAPLGCDSTPMVDGGSTGGQTAVGGSGSGGTGACAVEDKRWCDVSCSDPTTCPAGMYCDDTLHKCQAVCVAGETASAACAGQSCLENGKCADSHQIDGTGAGLNVTPGAGGSGQGGSGGTAECIDVQVDFNPVIPNVVLLIDQSLSMNSGDGFGEAVAAAIQAGTYTPWDCGTDSNWRWNVVRNVLLNPDGGFVKPLEDRVRFGLSLYSSNGGFGPDGTLTCPMTTDVSIAINNHAAMLDAFQCSDLLVDTPTRESLTNSAEALAGLMTDEPKVIVLATDGAPDNCTCSNWYPEFPTAPPECDEVARLKEQTDVVAEATRIYQELGTVIYVVDVSSPTQTDLRAHLSEVAAAGGGELFDGTNPTGLIEAFNKLTESVQSCAVDLDGMIASGKESTGVVTLNGEVLVLDGPDGWKVNSPTQIELVGAACASTKAGDVALDISFPCDAFIIK